MPAIMLRVTEEMNTRVLAEKKQLGLETRQQVIIYYLSKNLFDNGDKHHD